MSREDRDHEGPELSVSLLVGHYTALGLHEMLLAAMRLNRRDAEFLRRFIAASEDIIADGLNADFPDEVPLEMQEETVRIVMENLRKALKACMVEVGKPNE